MLKKLRTPLKPFYRSAALAFLWSNRRDVARWANFAKRAATPSTRPKTADLKLEARVRASLSSDPVLRADPSIRDVRVRDGIVVLETPADWRNKGLAITRLTQIPGVESVHTAVDANEQNFLDADLIDAVIVSTPIPV
jgi:hypothetical protein